MQTQTRVTVRPFTVADYEAIARLHNGTFGPEFNKKSGELRFEDEHQPAHCNWARWIAERDGKVVGFCGYTQPGHMYHPRRYSLTIVVDPSVYLNGVGRA